MDMLKIKVRKGNNTIKGNNRSSAAGEIKSMLYNQIVLFKTVLI